MRFRSIRDVLVAVTVLLLSACSPNPLERADHDMILVGGGVDGASGGVLMVGGWRRAGGTVVPLGTTVLLQPAMNRYRIQGTMSAPRQSARLSGMNGARNSKDAFIVGGENYLVDYYRGEHCAIRQLAKLNRQRLEGFTATPTRGTALVVGGWTLYAPPGVDPSITSNSTSADNTAELIENWSYSVNEFPRSCSALPFQAPTVSTNPRLATLFTMKVGRNGHTATNLAQRDDVLVIGGSLTNRLTEIFSATNRAFQDAGLLGQARANHTATLLQDGRILVAGGFVANPTVAGGVPSASAEIWNPATNGFTAITSTMSTARARHTATLLYDGRVLLTGGSGGSGNVLASSDIFDPATNTFSVGPTLRIARQRHAAIAMSGVVLVTGGIGADGATLSSAESWFLGTSIYFSPEIMSPSP